MDMLGRESWRDQVAENSARLAFAWGFSTTTGTGSIPHAKSIDFGLTFVEKPAFAYGLVILSTTIDLDADDAIFPLACGFVLDWVQDARGLYTGAHVGVTVQANAGDELEHHFSFSGTGLKDVTIDV